MKLNEYFKWQKCKLCDEQKLLIFDDVKSQITRESIFTRFSFYVKVSVYSLILVFLFSGIFLDFQNKVSDNVEIDTKVNTVQADFIWKVIQSDWVFEIYDNNKKLDTNLIRKWNTVVLKDNSYVKVAINEWIKVYLLWPAKISVDLEKSENWKDIYILNVIDWDYITLKSNSDKDKIVLKSKYLNIESNDKNIDIKYEEKKGVSIVENNGGSIIIKNKDKIIPLDKQEKLIVLNDDDKKYIESLFSDDYTKYQLSDWNLKKVISSNDLKVFDTLLDKEAVILSVWQYVLWKINNNSLLSVWWWKQLYNTAKTLYKVLGRDFDKPYSDKNLEKVLTKLLNRLEGSYILPDVYIQRLKVMLAYVIIVNKVNIPKWRKFNSLSSFVNYLKISDVYKRMLLKF